jgi:hypothetical protein
MFSYIKKNQENINFCVANSTVNLLDQTGCIEVKAAATLNYC